MKFPLHIVFVFLATVANSAEIVKRDTFQIKIDRINANLIGYDTLNPWSYDEGDPEKITSVQDEIMNDLLDILNDPKILRYDLDKIFKSESLGHTHSSDNRVHFFSIDEKTGGSFRSAITIIHTRDTLNHVHAQYLPDELGYQWYGHVVLVDKKHHIYSALGGVTTCNTCETNTAITIDASAEPSVESYFGFDTRRPWIYEFNFIDSTKTLKYHYADEVDHDLYADFFEADDTTTSNKYMLHHYSGEYTYHNGSFVLMEECWYNEIIVYED